MMTLELEQRERVCYEARRWLGTPYHHRAAVLGVGIDCALLLAQVFSAAGLLDNFEAPRYTRDWHLHRGEERYLGIIEDHCHRIGNDELPLADREIDFSPGMGDILMFRVGRTFSHSAIVTRWPFIIHSYLPSSIVEEVDITGTPMAIRPLRVYSYWGSPT